MADFFYLFSIFIRVNWQRFCWCLHCRYLKRTWWRSWRNWCSMWTRQKELPTETSSSPRSSTSAARATTSTSPTLNGGPPPPRAAPPRRLLVSPESMFIFRIFSWQVYQHPGGADAARGHPARPPHRLPDAGRGHPGQSHPGLCRRSDGHSARQRPPFDRQHAANGHLWSAVRCSLDLWRILRVRLHIHVVQSTHCLHTLQFKQY